MQREEEGKIMINHGGQENITGSVSLEKESLVGNLNKKLRPRHMGKEKRTRDGKIGNVNGTQSPYQRPEPVR